MSTKYENQRGFGMIGVLGIVLLVLIGGAGWYVLTTNKEESEPQQSQQNSDIIDAQTEGNEQAVEDWTEYSNLEGKFSLKYPVSWKLPTDFESCTPTTLLVGPDKYSVGMCQGDKISQVRVTSEVGDNRDRRGTIAISDEVESSVTIAGVDGTRRSLTYVDNDALTPYGTKSVIYMFFTNERTYRVVYSQPPDYPDSLSDFEKIVTQTLSFTN